MALLLETKHTLSTIEKIKSDLTKTFSFFNIISMIAFLAYYVYLIVVNVHKFLYITVYSVLIVCILLFFTVECLLNENKGFLRTTKRIITEKKRKIKIFIKILKYLAKTALIVIATSETKIYTDLQISNLINICSIILLLIQIVFDIIVNYTVKQIDYFRLSIGLDYEESIFIQKLSDLFHTTQSLEKKATLIEDKPLFTEQENEIREVIKKNALLFEFNKNKKKQALKKIIKDNKKNSKKIKIPKIFNIKKKK